MDKLIIEVAGEFTPTIPQIQEHLANGWSIHQLNTHLNDKGTVVVVVWLRKEVDYIPSIPKHEGF